MSKWIIDSLDEDLWLREFNNYNNYLQNEEKAIRDKKVTTTNIELVKKMNSEMFYDFIRNEFLIWKYTAKNRLAQVTNKFDNANYDDNNFNELNLIKVKLQDSNCSDEELLDAATSIKGIGWAGGTALLSCLYPNRFPTIDQFVTQQFLNSKNYGNLDIINKLVKHSKDGKIYYILNKKATLFMINEIQKLSIKLNSTFKNKIFNPRNIDKALFAAAHNK